MSSVFIHLFFLLGILSAGILYGLIVFAFASPKDFSRWFTPFYAITRFFIKHRPERYDRIFSYAFGSITFFLLIFLQFFLGGLAVTGLFELWASPYAFFFWPR